MPDLLLELFSEEIPARMQAGASETLKRLVTEAFDAGGLGFGEARAYATPRRLVLHIKDVAKASPAVVEERRGPRVGAPEKALAGFLRAAGLTAIADAEIAHDAKKGDYYVARSEKPGRAAAEIIAEVVPAVMARFPWQKSMRWGSGRFRWVRPLHAILCLLGARTIDFEVAGLRSANRTRGHSFMSPGVIKVRGFDDYVEKLRAAHVMLDATERAGEIERQARDIAKSQGLELVGDRALLAETAGLVEWPVVAMGTFDEAFLGVPHEVLTTAMKVHQKCFSLKEKKSGKLANRFLLVSNLEADDGGAEIIAGNERVIRARLSDARFFWQKDLATPLDEMAKGLDAITFHEKLGTVGERVERIKVLARELAPVVGADPDKAERAAALAKADLVSEMVGEFPELQGLMGRYYAEAMGEDAAVAGAIEDHYRPQGPSDRVPTEPVAIAVALADKLDMLVGFWAIDEKPTGSKDPFALRRAALGVVRMILGNSLRLNLVRWIDSHAAGLDKHMSKSAIERASRKGGSQLVVTTYVTSVWSGRSTRKNSIDLLAFFADRLRVHLRDQGARHELIDAVVSLCDQDDLLMIVRRIEALGRFLATEDGEHLLAGVKRAENILRIEEKKDKTTYDAGIDKGLLREREEKALANAIGELSDTASKAIAKEDFEGAMAALARLRAPVDAFFDHVTVNAEDPKLRENRLRLLAEIRETTRRVADFSKIAG